jgi:integrase
VSDQIADSSTPGTENFTVKRRYLTEREVERLIEAAKSNRYGHRDATMILVAYRHGLRASEVCSLEWHQIELDQGRLHSEEPSVERRASIPSVVMRSESCASYGVRTPQRPMCSLASAADQ